MLHRYKSTIRCLSSFVNVTWYPFFFRFFDIDDDVDDNDVEDDDNDDSEDEIDIDDDDDSSDETSDIVEQTINENWTVKKLYDKTIK